MPIAFRERRSLLLAEAGCSEPEAAEDGRLRLNQVADEHVLCTQLVGRARPFGTLLVRNPGGLVVSRPDAAATAATRSLAGALTGSDLMQGQQRQRRRQLPAVQLIGSVGVAASLYDAS